MLLKSMSFFCLLCALIGIGSAPAYAYLDPGTGSMILQVLLGGVAGLAIAGKFYWHRFLTLIGMRSEPVAPAATDELKSRADR